MGKQWKQWLTLFSWAPKSPQMVTAAVKLKDLAPWEKSYEQTRQHIKKQRHYFPAKGLSSQNYGFSSSHVWMWELDYKESWEQKNWCFWTVVLKTLESPLACKEIQPVHPKGNQSWIFTGRTDAEAETPIFGHMMQRTDSLEKTLVLGRLRVVGEQGNNRGWDGWMALLTQWSWVWVSPGVGDRQGGLGCCSPWGRKRVGHNLATKQQLQHLYLKYYHIFMNYILFHLDIIFMFKNTLYGNRI